MLVYHKIVYKWEKLHAMNAVLKKKMGRQLNNHC